MDELTLIDGPEAGRQVMVEPGARNYVVWGKDGAQVTYRIIDFFAQKGPAVKGGPPVTGIIRVGTSTDLSAHAILEVLLAHYRP